MKRLLILIVLIAFHLQLRAQGWLTDLKMAQGIAKDSDKLILVDFWATWCGPCKQMDAQVWNTEEAATIKQNFVPVKIDIDYERALAMQYGVRSIPMLILMDYKGENIYSYTGYKGKDDLMNFISAIPVNSSDLFAGLAKIESKKDENYQNSKELGIAYQMLSQAVDYSPLQRSLLTKSEQWFRKSAKLSGNDLETNETELFLSLNAIYRNSYKKALAGIETNKTKYIDTPNESLMYYVLAQGYKKSGDDKNYKEAIASLEKTDTNREYLSKLEE
ncbi:MAG: thioredoxin family protein [Cyclobacteriaceae bacterium]|nr:thioredoxin family protein [Cyclobacteriaceae bacterium]